MIPCEESSALLFKSGMHRAGADEAMCQGILQFTQGFVASFPPDNNLSVTISCKTIFLLEHKTSKIFKLKHGI